MICDDLCEEEILQAFLIYSSLHGFCTDEDSVRERIADYFQHNVPDEMIDDAILAYTEDRIIAPPDVVLERWGTSRFYELNRSRSDLRHQTCESWFENGCRFTSAEDAPRLAHFWTEFPLSEEASEFRPDLVEGVRLQFVLGAGETVKATHRDFGDLGELPEKLAREMHAEPLRTRTYLPLIDKEPQEANHSDTRIQQDSEQHVDQHVDQRNITSKLLVTTASEGVPVTEIVVYAADAFHAARTKC